MAGPPLRVQTPLNLIMPILPGRTGRLLLVLATSSIREQLRALGNVHFAQFVLLDGGTRLGVFTIYDGDFDDYVLSFVTHVGDTFDDILEHIDVAHQCQAGVCAVSTPVPPPLQRDEVTPVRANRARFLEFIRRHDVPGLDGLFRAYPDTRAFDIQDALGVQP